MNIGGMAGSTASDAGSTGSEGQTDRASLNRFLRPNIQPSPRPLEVRRRVVGNAPVGNQLNVWMVPHCRERAQLRYDGRVVETNADHSGDPAEVDVAGQQLCPCW